MFVAPLSGGSLLKFFGPEKPLRGITPGDAEEWRRNLGILPEAEQKAREKSGKKPAILLSENTRRKHTAVVKVFFNAAVKKRLIPSNPFEDLKATIIPNPQRFYFITPEEATKVLDACLDVEWRLLFALSRYGGLRCPSEHLSLRWEDVDWARGKIRVRSPKTAHFVGKDSRFVPIFPELRPHLEEAFELAADGAEFVIARYQGGNVNLRTQLHRIIDRAGVKPWPKLFQNLRSTRQTELEETYPSHVVCAWLGNSKAVARDHYLQVTDKHFAKAAAVIETEEKIPRTEKTEKTRCKIRRTHYEETARTGGKVKTQTPGFAVPCNAVHGTASVHMTPTGLEPVLPA